MDKNIKVILSHPTANNFVRALSKKLIEKGMLFNFYTSLAFFPGGLIEKISEFSLLSELRRRMFDLSLKPFVKTRPYYEIGRLIATKLKIDFLIRHEKGMFSVDTVYKKLDIHVAYNLNKIKEEVKIVYASEDGALSTFTKAKSLGVTCAYDLPIAYFETLNKLMAEEAERLPNWASTIGGGIQNSTEKLERKVQELKLADIVIVPSKFVSDSLPEWAYSKRIVMAPFGSPIPSPETIEWVKKKQVRHSRPLRVMFAGSMGQRKGLGDLFNAIKLLNSSEIELVVMGSLQCPLEFYKKELPNFTFEPGRPNREVLELMRSCDVFCLPSIVEGRALVMQEAMSQGLPLIITPNTGGEDLIIEGQTGFLVPIRSPESIAQEIEWCNNNRDKLIEMGIEAQLHASKYTWDGYGRKIVEGIT